MATAQFGVAFSQKKVFFDRANVQREVGKANARALSRHGAFVRRRARSSLRRRKRTSRPGEKPSVHTTDSVATLKNIWFAYDSKNQSVVVGPLRLNLHSALWGSGGRELTTGAVPGILEHGGRVGIRKMRQPDGSYKRVPFGLRRKPERLVPVWKATAAEKTASAGVVTLYRGGRALNFYRIPNPPSVIVWANIAARPFMGPAGLEEIRREPNLWGGTGRAA